ncbi:hypothetical protein EJB05_34508 [Eragrostis curvula]|uniref:CR-type domain-containing protein n=1 Tax=Eragrostis curvula TaxID=38414 RepID=A0A5J9U3W5_9POAL|nr:hypothetical protein EJB05_34508 [Eragrostis curvula]
MDIRFCGSKHLAVAFFLCLSSEAYCCISFIRTDKQLASRTSLPTGSINSVSKAITMELAACLRWTSAVAFAPVDRSWRTRKPAMASKRGARIMVVSADCKTCKGKGAVECPGCKGTGKNKKNGNIFERWKCFDCQGFGLKSCPSCGKGGLTPEQRGER